VALLALSTAALMLRFLASDFSPEFLLTSLVVAVIPGTGVVYTISNSITGGWRRGWLAAVGCTLGIVPHLLVAMVGLSGVMQAGTVALEAVRWAGVAYLIFMGVSMIGDGGALRPEMDRPASTEPARRVVWRAIFLNLLNPKLTLFFFAFLPQFLGTRPQLFDARLVGLGGVFMLTTLAVFIVYAWASAAIRERILRAPSVQRWVQRSLGALLVAFAIRLTVADPR
jgi:threonine/homoserine/homoserine lactone efflux protein